MLFLLFNRYRYNISILGFVHCFDDDTILEIYHTGSILSLVALDQCPMFNYEVLFEINSFL